MAAADLWQWRGEDSKVICDAAAGILKDAAFSSQTAGNDIYSQSSTDTGGLTCYTCAFVCVYSACIWRGMFMPSYFLVSHYLSPWYYILLFSSFIFLFFSLILTPCNAPACFLYTWLNRKPPKANNRQRERVNCAFPSNNEGNLVENDQLVHYGISQYL